MVVLNADSTAGRRDGYTFVPLLAQADRPCFTHCQPAFLLLKSAPPRGNLSQQKCLKRSTLFRCALHSRLPSAPQRYNTLDFPDGKSCAKGTPSPLDTLCQQGCSRPYWKPRGKAGVPLESLLSVQWLSIPSTHAGFSLLKHEKQA